MNDHNLEDLIIGDPEPTSSRSKKLLSLIALVIVILIVGLILWALLFSAPSTEPTSTAAQEQNQTQSLEPTFLPLEPTPQTTHQPAPKPVSKPTPAPKPRPVARPVPKPQPKPKPTPKPQPVKPTAPNVPKTPTTPVIPTGGELIENANHPIYYIQVGAFKNPPSSRFLQKLKQGGFTFITKNSKGIRRVRVGPYDNYTQAKAALSVVKSKLGIDGLIVKY